jgi:hypothetical protein
MDDDVDNMIARWPEMAEIIIEGKTYLGNRPVF